MEVDTVSVTKQPNEVVDSFEEIKMISSEELFDNMVVIY